MNHGHANLPRPSRLGDTFADVLDRWTAWYEIDANELARTPTDAWRYEVLLRCLELDSKMVEWALKHRRRGKGVAA